MTTAREELEDFVTLVISGPIGSSTWQAFERLFDAALAEARAEGYAEAREEACNFEHDLHSVFIQGYCPRCT